MGSGDGAPSPGDYGIDVHRTVNAKGPALGDDGSTPPDGQQRSPEQAEVISP